MALKIHKRFRLIALSGINFYVTSLYSVILSALIIRLHSANLWGQMAIVQLWIGIAANVCYWGNKEFLVREFSRNSFAQASIWERFLSVRIWVLLAEIIFLVFFSIENVSSSLLIVFLVARFIYQSYDPVITFRRKFMLSIFVETISFLVISGSIVLMKSLTIGSLTLVFVCAELIKASIVSVYFQKEFSPFKITLPHFNLLKDAAFFFLLGFAGLLASRSDLMCVSSFLSQADIAHYQVFVNFLLLASGISVVILQPFIKNIYRLRQPLISRLSLRLFFFGMFMAPGILLLIYFVVYFIYNFQLSIFQLLLGTLFIIPGFGFSAIIYNLFKHNRQNVVILISLFAAVFIYGFTFALMKTVSVNLNNGLIAITASNWLMLFIYLLLNSQYRLKADKAVSR